MYSSVNESTPINTDANGYAPRPHSKCCCKYIIHHNIPVDIPPYLQKLVKLVFGHCFFTAGILLLNFFVALIVMCLPHDSYDDDMLFADLVISPVWFVGWTLLDFVFYSALYSSLAEHRPKKYHVFFCGYILEIILTALGIAGIPHTALMGFVQGVKSADDSAFSCVLCIVVAIAFVLNMIFLVYAMVAVDKGYKKAMRDERIAVEGNDAIRSKIGTTQALPNEVGGRKVTYLPVNGGSSSVEKLSALPEDSITVISEWKRVDASPGEAYILYVENEPGRAYWSNSHIADIINSGSVNPVTQVLTISRLPGGSFVFGVADKE